MPLALPLRRAWPHRAAGRPHRTKSGRNCAIAESMSHFALGIVPPDFARTADLPEHERRRLCVALRDVLRMHAHSVSEHHARMPMFTSCVRAPQWYVHSAACDCPCALLLVAAACCIVRVPPPTHLTHIVIVLLGHRKILSSEVRVHVHSHPAGRLHIGDVRAGAPYHRSAAISPRRALWHKAWYSPSWTSLLVLS